MWDIRKRIKTRLEHWSRGNFDMLVEDTVCASISLINIERQSMTDEHITKTYTRLAIQGKLRQAVRFVIKRKGSGVLTGDVIDVKSGERVLDVLISKHPLAVIPDAEILEDYAYVPALVPLDISCDTIEKVTK